MIEPAHFVVDPERVFFVIPYINHPVTWYGLLFAFGFLIGYFVVRKIFTEQLRDRGLSDPKLVAALLADRLAMITVVATVVGARLGHVFLYDWHIYKERPWDIIKVWEGGLASHGAAIGILLGLVLFTVLHRRKYQGITFLATLDAVVVGAAFAGGCIRIGNFINQEILGKPTDVPWAVGFMHPLEGPFGVPVHPVQLYESAVYFFVFGLLWFTWKKGGQRVGAGLLTGLFFLLVFTSRFYIEYFKLPLSQLVGEEPLFNMGQLLSIPFILLGAALIIYYLLKRRKIER